MSKILKNKKGLTVVTVLIIMTVLVLLCAILLEAVMSSIVLTKRHNNIDLAYYAGESAIENWAAMIDKQIVINKESIGDGYPGGSVSVNNPGSRDLYAEFIVNNKIDKSKLYPQNIDIEFKNSSAFVEFVNLEKVGTDWDPSCGDSKIYILIGIKGKASYSSASAYNTGNKEVYAIKKFKVSIPVQSQLEGAVYTVGDFYINGNNNPAKDVVKIKGDVFTFGSYAKSANSTKQEYYGGIYATKHGMLKVYGNAYSRSFIRTGPYQRPSDTPDSSSIVIFKDAIAQCIQAFGHNTTIAAYRNAYTFDDIEINSDNSVIAINGSFFGLSNGGGTTNHDESSAIVNSAMVHQELSSGSFNSRITINGDVLVGGSTWKVDTDTNQGLGTIEDASLAYDKVGKFPHYKSFSNWKIDDSVPYDYEEYHLNLRSNEGNINSELNQFQVFNPINPFDASFDDKLDINDSIWITSIRSNSYDIAPPSRLKGISYHEMAANNRLYKNNLIRDAIVPQFDANLNIKNGTYVLDNIFDNTSNLLVYDKAYWQNVGSTDLSSELFGETDSDPRGGKCGEILKALLGKVNKYAVRDYSKYLSTPVPSATPAASPTPTTANRDWGVAESIEFGKTLYKINKISNQTGSMYTLCNSETANSGEKDLADFFAEYYALDTAYPAYLTSWGASDIYDVCRKSRENGFENDTEYFIIANENKDLTLEINGEFNGIIVTAGKIKLGENASVYGSLIAAGGRGDYGDRDLDGTTERIFLPEAKSIDNSAECSALDDGEYAAISTSADGDGSTTPYVDFFLGKAGGINDNFTIDSMKEVIRTARNTPRGGSLIPDSLKDPNTGNFDENSNEYLAYLNRAARINLLQKFDDKGLNLFSIF